jgi:hypothetical protein
VGQKFVNNTLTIDAKLSTATPAEIEGVDIKSCSKESIQDVGLSIEKGKRIPTHSNSMG